MCINDMYAGCNLWENDGILRISSASFTKRFTYLSKQKMLNWIIIRDVVLDLHFPL